MRSIKWKDSQAHRCEIYLRPMEITDTDLIVSWRNKDSVRNHFIYREPFTKEGHLNWIHTQIEPGHVVQFMIYEASAGRAVGSVYLRDIDREKGVAEYGVFIGEEDALGKGYGTQAAKLVLTYAYEELNLKSVFLRVFADNMRARRSYEKAGFRQLMVKQENVVIDGVEKEVVFYELHLESRKLSRDEEI